MLDKEKPKESRPGLALVRPGTDHDDGAFPSSGQSSLLRANLSESIILVSDARMRNKERWNKKQK